MHAVRRKLYVMVWGGGGQCRQELGRRASAATAGLETYATGEPGYLGDRPNPGLDPKSSGRIEAPMEHCWARRGPCHPHDLLRD